MATVNKSTLVTKLQTYFDQSYTLGSLDEGDILSLSLSARALGEVNIITVATVNDLPDIGYYNSPNGMLYYIEDTDIFGISSNGKWLTLDGRTLRIDISNVLWSWGQNSNGQLGINNTAGRSSPVSVVGGFTDWCQISGDAAHSIGLRMNCTIWTWGNGACGRLGDGTLTGKSSPVSVVGGFTDWCQIGSGRYHSLGIRTDGTLWAWGAGTTGSLGDNSATNRSSPVSVVGGFTDWCRVVGGRYFSIGLRSNGTLWGWGSNGSGRLGDNSATNRSSPVSVVGGFTDWCQVAAGSFSTMGIRTNGTLWAWGSNDCGRLGDGTIIARSSPVSVVGGFTDWCQVAAGPLHSAGLRTNGTIWTWGSNCVGVLGDGTTTCRSSPVSVVGGFTDWCAISAGTYHSIGLRTNGTAWTWGGNGVGQLGDNTIVIKSSPVSVVGGFTGWSQVSAGENHNLGIIST